MRVWIVAACLLVSAFAVLPTATADPLDGCVGKPGQVQGCTEVNEDAQCVGIGFGLQGVGACHRPGGIAVCTSSQGALSCLHAETVI